MPWKWRTTHDGPSNTWTTTCTVCGDSKKACNHSELVTFRRLHVCPGLPPTDDTTSEGARA